MGMAKGTISLRFFVCHREGGEEVGDVVIDEEAFRTLHPKPYTLHPASFTRKPPRAPQPPAPRNPHPAPGGCRAHHEAVRVTRGSFWHHRRRRLDLLENAATHGAVGERVTGSIAPPLTRRERARRRVRAIRPRNKGCKPQNHKTWSRVSPRNAQCGGQGRRRCTAAAGQGCVGRTFRPVGRPTSRVRSRCCALHLHREYEYGLSPPLPSRHSSTTTEKRPFLSFLFAFL